MVEDKKIKDKKKFDYTKLEFWGIRIILSVVVIIGIYLFTTTKTKSDEYEKTLNIIFSLSSTDYSDLGSLSIEEEFKTIYSDVNMIRQFIRDYRDMMDISLLALLYQTKISLVNRLLILYPILQNKEDYKFDELEYGLMKEIAKELGIDTTNY